MRQALGLKILTVCSAILLIGLRPAVAGPVLCALTCPDNITTSTDANECSAEVNPEGFMQAGDCENVQCSPAFGSTFPLGTTTVACSDDTTGLCDFTVTVNDTIPPTIGCTASQESNNDANLCGAVPGYAAPEATDNCPDLGTAVCAPADNAFFPVGTTTVTCEVADEARNTATCKFTIQINDTQPPTITAPSDQKRLSTDGAVTVTYPPPTAGDNCPGETAGCLPASGTQFPVGITTVTCTATDASGNTATAAFLVFVAHAVPVLGTGLMIVLCAGLAAVAVRRLRARA